jgi:hypothetical protein
MNSQQYLESKKFYLGKIERVDLSDCLIALEMARLETIIEYEFSGSTKQMEARKQLTELKLKNGIKE